ncbi:hypothetical protein [Streptomyces sp.]|uniref:hypothetical protein n=1 Tax=Streptomyces sp. TaxID=1931 RepID=UPI002F92E1C5
MRQPTLVGSSITTHGGDAKVHGRMLPVAPIELAELLLGASQAAELDWVMSGMFA